jgi:sterol desaturase/sphingolipid hydroxylase (fatty acid hydroxylase superfamily)
VTQEATYDPELPCDAPVLATGQDGSLISDQPANSGRTLKQTIFRYYQPATVFAYLAFWGLGPTSITHNPLTPVILGPSLALMIFSLEFINERYESWRITEQEFLRDFFYVVLSYSLMGFLGSKLVDEPLSALKQHLGIATPWFTALPFLVQAFTVFFLIEFLQYWIHRMMHNTHIVWSIHGPHHYLTQLNAYKSGVGHPIELLVLQLSVVGLLDVRTNALFCGIGLVSVVAKFAHANVRFDPPRWYSYIFVTIEAHSLHHSTDYDATRSNYANALLLIDRACGTFRAGDTESIGMPGRVPQSIWQQMIFPYTYLSEVYGRSKSPGA